MSQSRDASTRGLVKSPHAVSARKPKALEQDVYTLAKERVAHAMTDFDHVCVAFSGGKDSTAVLNVALEVAHSDPRFAKHLPLRATFFDEECIPYETEEYVRRVSRREDVALEWYCLPVKHRNACSRESPNWWPWAPEARELWARPLPPEALTELAGFPMEPPKARLSIPDANGLLTPPKLGNAVMLMGIRAAESLTRRRAVLVPREVPYLIPFNEGTARGNLWKCYPIYDWRTEDVWTAPAMLGWDYNHAYDLMEMAGVSAASQRCSPAFGEEPMQKLYLYAQCFPDVWGRMVDRVPGVGAAYRYARTELYGYGKKPEKPVGMPWEQFILHYLGEQPEGIRKQVASRVYDIIRRHYRQTTTPILRNAPNPESGVSWEFLLMIAMRGDFKERKQPAHRLSRQLGPENKLRARYTAELTATIEAGTFAELCFPGPAPADPSALFPPLEG